MIEFLAHCDFQAAFGFLAFFTGFISFVSFALYSTEHYKEHNPAILRFAKIFLVLLLVSVFFVAALPSKEELAQTLLAK